MTSNATTAAASTTKRACDACHRRKVRCNGSHPCQNCLQAGLACTFNKPPQKKGPKGSRAKVISELRKTQKVHGVILSPTTQSATSTFESPPPSPSSSSRASDLLSLELIESCTSSYFLHVYPTVPILHQSQVDQHRLEINTSTEAYCLLGSLCAFILIQPGLPGPIQSDGQELPGNSHNIAQGAALVEEIIRVRNMYNHVDSPSTTAAVTAFFLSACYFGLERHNSSWFYLRESITLVQILGMQDEASYAPESVDSMMKRQLFWLLFVAERAYAIHKDRPITLHATIEFPNPEQSECSVALTGLCHLANLFRIIDDEFSRVWNKARSECSVSWLTQLQRQLTEALPEDIKCTEIQEADLRVTQQWLRSIVWQLATASGCLSSQSADVSMTFSYPIKIAGDLLSTVNRLSRQSLEIHGIGLIEKLFDIACTLIDVMSCVPIETATCEIGPQDCLHDFLHLISTLRGGDSRYLGLLQGKIRETLPSMAASFGLALYPHISFDRVASYESSCSSNSTSYDSPPRTVTSPLHYPGYSPTFSLSGYTSVPMTTTAMPTTSSLAGPYMYGERLLAFDV